MVINTGIAPLDKALLLGGVPTGHITEIVGEESTGKSFVCMSLLASACQKGLKCAYFDTEYSFSPSRAALMGVSQENLTVVQPYDAETCQDNLWEMMLGNDFRLVIIDSLNGMAPQMDMVAEMEDVQPFTQLNFMRDFLPSLSNFARGRDVAVVVTNQYRERQSNYGTPYFMSLANDVMREEADIRLLLKTQKIVEKDGDAVGQMIEAAVKRNNLAKECRLGQFYIKYE